jgi:2-polyprenyl-6-methoxyphenol hydroxylase-like FAD-dependent oxidoreductase
MATKKFAIVGAGIGGLTLAIAMQRKGFDVTVYEGAPEIKAIGAGITLAANAVKGLMEVGIADEVLQAGKALKGMFIKDEKGNILTHADSEKLSAKLGIINSFSIHRADLHRILLAQLAPGTVHLNKLCIDVIQNSDTVALHFRDGTQAIANYVIACDGIHSVIRKKFLPESNPRYAGYTCWRAVISDIPLGVNMDETIETWGAGSRFGIVPLPDNRIYWFACINSKPNDPVMRNFQIPSLLVYFSKFHSPVANVLKKTKNDQLIWSDIMDLKPLKKFAFGNILLMGDAAHATTPNMGQGACMAIEDAATLSNCLEQYLTAEEAFFNFERKRIERTTKIVNASRALGKVAHWENPVLTKLRNTMIRLTPSKVAENQVKFLTDISFL